MLEAVSIESQTLDIGELAESLVYFGRVDLTVDRRTLDHLIDSVTPSGLLRLLEGRHLHLHFFDASPITPNLITKHGRSAFYLSLISMSGNSKVSVPWSTPRQVMVESYLHRHGITKANRKFIEQVSDYTSFEIVTQATALHTMDELRSSSAVPHVATKYFQDTHPGADLSDLTFHIEMVDDNLFNSRPVPALIVETGYDFGSKEDIRHAQTVTFALDYLSLNGAIKRSAFGNTDLRLSPRLSKLLGYKIDSLKMINDENRRQINDFQSVVLDRLSFRELVNDKKLPFYRIIDILEDENTRRMKGWLHAQGPHANVVSEYHKCIFSKEKSLTPVQEAVRIISWEGLSSVVVNALTGGLSATIQPLASSVASIALDRLEEAGSRAVGRTLAKWSPREWVENVAKPLGTSES